MTHVTPSLSQVGFRGRNDNGSQTTATWKATENTNWTQLVDTNFRVRFVVDETAGGTENNISLQLQYNLASGGWNNVTSTSNVVRAFASSNFAEEAATTRQLTSGTGTFVTGAMDEVDGIAGSGNQIDFTSGGELTEVEYCVQIRSADVTDAQTLQLRVIRSGGTLDAWTQTPTITVSEPATAAYTSTAYRLRNDDGSESGATWKYAQNTNGTVDAFYPFRVRFEIQETAGGSSANDTFQLQYNLASAGWNNVTGASSVVRAIASSNVTDDGATTNILTAGTGTFQAGRIEEADGVTGTITIPANGHTEVEYVIYIIDTDVTDAQSLQLRVTSGNGVTVTQTNIPTITINDEHAYEQVGFRFRNDDGSESAATWKENQNVDWAPGASDLDVAFRLRIEFDNTGTRRTNETWTWQYSKNSGTWTNITTTSNDVYLPAGSGSIWDGLDTTDQLTAGQGTFSVGDCYVQVGSHTPDPPQGDHSEAEVVLEIKSADVSNGDTLDFRIVHQQGASVTTYTQVPRATVTLATLHSLAPAVDATSTVTVALTPQHKVDGLVAATSTCTVALTVDHKVDATVASISTVDIILAKIRDLIVQIDATSDVQAVLSHVHAITAQIDALSTVTIAVVEDHLLAVQVDAVFTLEILLDVAHQLIAQIDATSDVQILIQKTKALLVAIDATSTVDAVLSHEHGLVMAVDGSSTVVVSNSLNVGHALPTTIDGTSDIQVVLQSTTEHNLPTAIDATSTVTVALSVDHSLTMAVDVTSDVQFALSHDHALPTTVAATSDVQFVLSHEHGLVTAIDSTSDIQAVLSHEHGLIQAIDGTSDVQVALTTSGVVSLVVAIDATSTVTAALTVDHDLAHLVGAASDIQVVLTQDHGLAPAIDGTSDVQFALSTGTDHTLQVAVDATSTVDVALSVDHQVDALLTSTSTIQAVMSHEHGLAVQVDGLSDVQVSIALDYALAVLIAGTSDIQFLINTVPFLVPDTVAAVDSQPYALSLAEAQAYTVAVGIASTYTLTITEAQASSLSVVESQPYTITIEED